MRRSGCRWGGAMENAGRWWFEDLTNDGKITIFYGSILWKITIFYGSILWKITIFNGSINYKRQFSIAFCIVYQRVTLGQS